MVGTWHSLVVSEVIIKRQFNHIRVAAIIRQGISSRKMYFLLGKISNIYMLKFCVKQLYLLILGYTEEMLSYWLQCPITLELQTTPDKKDVIFKYI